MTQRVFRVYTGRYGGELTVGTVDPDFVQYWQGEDESDLIEHCVGAQWGEDDDLDPDSPPMIDGENIPWHECDDIEHLNGPYSDNQYFVTEVKLHEDAEIRYGELCWKEGVDHDFNIHKFEEVGDESEGHDYNHFLYGREGGYASDDEPDWDDEASEDVVPVLIFHSAEKGGFGELYVTTEGEDFDHDKFCIGVCETDLGTIIETYYYDEQELEVDWGYADTNGKGYYARVAWLNKKWHDNRMDYGFDGEYIKDALQEHRDYLEWQAEQAQKEAV